MKKSFAAMTLASAGAISPAVSWITSPGTSPEIGISCLVPSLETVAVVATLFARASAAFPARYSWVKSRMTLTRTMIKIIAASLGSPKKPEAF